MKVGEWEVVRGGRHRFQLGDDPMDYVEVYYEYDAFLGHHLEIRGGDAISVRPDASNSVSITIPQARVRP